jgi:hypothetical protein
MMSDTAKALHLMGRRTPPVAMCTACPNEPLVFTFERAGYEFTCLGCGGWFGFLDPRPAEATPELDALAEVRKLEYRALRAAREGAPR